MEWSGVWGFVEERKRRDRTKLKKDSEIAMWERCLTPATLRSLINCLVQFSDPSLQQKTTTTGLLCLLFVFYAQLFLHCYPVKLQYNLTTIRLLYFPVDHCTACYKCFDQFFPFGFVAPSFLFLSLFSSFSNSFWWLTLLVFFKKEKVILYFNSKINTLIALGILKDRLNVTNNSFKIH